LLFCIYIPHFTNLGLFLGDHPNVGYSFYLCYLQEKHISVYEDKYLRENVNRLIAKQRGGKFIIAAYKDGSGLPAREDLGAELGRAAFPYDYTMDSFGFPNFLLDLEQTFQSPASVFDDHMLNICANIHIPTWTANGS